MKKFGFLRKDKGDKRNGSEDRNSNSSTPVNSNPYAHTAPDQYTSSPPAYNNDGRESFRERKTPAYTSANSGGMEGDRFAATPVAGGYGSGGANRFGSSSVADSQPTSSKYGSGGYGGFGAAAGGAAHAPAPSRHGGAERAVVGPEFANSRHGKAAAEPAMNPYGRHPAEFAPSRGLPEPTTIRNGGGAANERSGRFGNPGGHAAPASRYDSAPRSASARVGMEQDAQRPSQWESGQGPSYGNATSQGYGGYDDRELTAEEKEDQDVEATKVEIKKIREESLASTSNALRIAAMAEEAGRQTLERLQVQGERIHNTERHLDESMIQNRFAKQQTREIEELNGSMFAVHMRNPFTSGKRMQEKEQEVLQAARENRERREATRNAAFTSQTQADAVGKEMRRDVARLPKTRNVADRFPLLFEEDEEDKLREDKIEENLESLMGTTIALHKQAIDIGKIAESQNKHIARIGGKVEKVDDEIALNKNRLDRIH